MRIPRWRCHLCPTPWAYAEDAEAAWTTHYTRVHVLGVAK